MISVVIPTLDSERGLLATLGSLVSAAADGAVRDVVVMDGGSHDGTAIVADAAGCTFVAGERSRAARLTEGARRGRGQWLLFLTPGVEVEEGWFREARLFMERVERQGATGRRAGVFRFAVDDFGFSARAAEWRVALRGLVTGRPLGEQGLLIHRSFYEALGGFRALSGVEDVDLLRRIGMRRRVRLRARLLIPADCQAPQSEELGSGLRRTLGYSLLALRVPPRLVARLYS